MLNKSAAAAGSLTATTLDFRIAKDPTYGFASTATIDEVAVYAASSLRGAGSQSLSSRYEPGNPDTHGHANRNAYRSGNSHATTTPTATSTAPASATPTNTSTPGATATPPSSSPYSIAISGTAGLQDYYRLDQASGTVATDSTGARNGVINGTVTYGVTGALTGDPDTAMAFNGSTGYIDVANGSAALAGGSMSIEGWAKLPNAPATHGFLFGLRNETNADFYLLQLQGTNTLEARFRNSSGTATTLTSTALTPGVWHYLAFTYSGSTISLYVDGVLNKSAAASGTITATTVPLRIAKDAVYGFASTASIDEVAIYATALSAAQEASHYQTGTTPGTATPTSTPTSRRHRLRQHQRLTGTATATATNTSTATNTPTTRSNEYVRQSRPPIHPRRFQPVPPRR